MTYAEKLKSPIWQKKRLEILSRDNWTCQLCGDASNTLHVHHKVYEKGKNPWEVDEKFLVTLCESCHEAETAQLKEYSELFIDTFKRSEFFADDLRELASGISNLKVQHMPRVVASAYAYALSDPEMQALIIEKYFNKLSKENEGFEF